MSMTFYVVDAAGSNLLAEEFEVNMANSNALWLLEELGVEPKYCGFVVAKEMAQKCAHRLMRQTERTPATPSTQYGGDGCATVIFCGRREGYLEDNLRRLYDLATYPGAHEVRWA